MSITGLVHVNVNCSDFERSKAFYEMLGFEVFMDPLESNTPEVAAAVSEAEEVTEEVATVEAAVAGRGTSVGLAEEPVVAEDAEPIGGHLPSSLPFRL